MAQEKDVRLEGAPYWYGTPWDQLEFEWSREEKLEIERYCQKILKNIAEEEMTPLQRFKATMAGKEKDRLMIENLVLNPYTVRTLDSGADALKPIDIFRNPKLLVKAHLATVARFGLDYPMFHYISATDEFWGNRAKMVEYGAPVVVERAIKSVEDLEGMKVPDPKTDGLYPGYLWAGREMRRIFDEYGLSKVMPWVIAICGGPLGIAMEAMLGLNRFAIALRKDPELCRKSLDLATEWVIRYGQAVLEIAAPDALWMCDIIGAMPTKGNEWLADCWAKAGKALAPQRPIWTTYSYALATEWLPVMYERGALGPGSLCGGVCSYPMDYKKTIDFHREHDLYCSVIPPGGPMTRGDMTGIEEVIRVRCEYVKSHPKGAMAIGPDYWTAQESFQAGVSAAKKYGKF